MTEPPIAPRQRTARAATVGLAAAFVVQVSFGHADDDRALVAYRMIGGAIPASLTGQAGDPVRGREIAGGREGNCLACHPMPIPEQQFHGDLGPDLAGVGARLSDGEIRLRLVDPKQVNPDTIMPSFYKRSGLRRVARRYLDQPILEAQQIEDVIAYLATLTAPAR